jgi:hypothetical protein
MERRQVMGGAILNDATTCPGRNGPAAEPIATAAVILNRIRLPYPAGLCI